MQTRYRECWKKQIRDPSKAKYLQSREHLAQKIEINISYRRVLQTLQLTVRLRVAEKGGDGYDDRDERREAKARGRVVVMGEQGARVDKT